MIQKYMYGFVEVLAAEVTPASVDEITRWCGGKQVEEIDALDSTKKYVGVNVPCMGRTGEAHRASEGDFVVRTPTDGYVVIGGGTFRAYYKEQ